MELQEVPPERVDIAYFRKVGLEFRVAWTGSDDGSDLCTEAVPGLVVSNKFGITVVVDAKGIGR